MGLGWAQTVGIQQTQIRTYIGQLTSVILRSDTFVTNHGWENGQVTSFPSVLQAGTAVLVNQYGEPVTRCYCGNPLTPPPTTGYEPTYYGPTWRWWNPTSITVIKQSVTIINNYTMVNVYKPSETYTVPAGGNVTDVIPTKTTTPTPTPLPTVEPQPAPSYSTRRPTPTSHYTAQQAINRWHQARARCSDSQFSFPRFVSYREWANPTGEDGVYLYTIEGHPATGPSLTFTWLINLTNGAIIPHNALAQQGAQECSELYVAAQ